MNTTAHVKGCLNMMANDIWCSSVNRDAGPF